MLQKKCLSDGQVALETLSLHMLMMSELRVCVWQFLSKTDNVTLTPTYGSDFPGEIGRWESFFLSVFLFICTNYLNTMNAFQERLSKVRAIIRILMIITPRLFSHDSWLFTPPEQLKNVCHPAWLDSVLWGSLFQANSRLLYLYRLSGSKIKSKCTHNVSYNHWWSLCVQTQ